MNDPSDRRTSNPFATRFIRPGAVPYVFPPGVSAAMLRRRLETRRWRGQIVGPHGSGKSTLLAELIVELERAGRAPRHVALHDGQRRLPCHLTDPAGLDESTQLVVDGCEQLPFWRWAWLDWWCRRRGVGLLVTSHRPLRLPVLWRTTVDLPRAWSIVEYLQRDCERLIRPDDVAAALPRHDGDIREVLFSFYDLYNQRQR